MKCPKCGSKKTQKRGRQIYCKSCNSYPKIVEQFENPSILIFDIETLYMVVDVWQPKTDWIPPECVEKDWCILAWAAKWLGDDKIISDILTPEEAKNRDDKRLCQASWKMLDEADILIIHNGKNFDVKKLNWRYFEHKMSPPASYKLIDTLEGMKAVFGASYNNLDTVAKKCGFSGKPKMVFKDWQLCDRGDKQALAKMRDYNENDVILLEEVYKRIRSWIPNHPRINVYEKSFENDQKCPVCMGERTFIGYYQAPQKKYAEFRCLSCGSVHHSTKPEK